MPWPWLALLLAMCFLAISRGGTPGGLDVPHYLVFFSIAFIVYLAALAALIRAVRRRASNGPRSSVRLPSLTLIWIAAVIFRIALLLARSDLSDDVYRYIWDGHLAAHGVNPYLLTVDSPALDGVATALRAQVNNPWMASPYLPTAQILFGMVALVAPQSPLAFQTAMAGFDLLAGYLVMQLLRRVGRPPELAVVYLWNPLVVTEFAGGAHIDALMLALMLGVLLALPTRPGRGGEFSAGLLALATLTKGLPALLLAVVWPRWRPREWLTYAGLCLGLALPYALGAGLGLLGPRNGAGLFGAIRIYGYEWNYNGGLYHWLEGLTTGLWLPGAAAPGQPGAQLARWAAAAAFAGLTGWIVVRARRAGTDSDLLRLAATPFAAYLLLTTTVHPWYVTALIPFAAFELGADLTDASDGQGLRFGPRLRLLWAPLVYWSWSVALAYLTYLDPAAVRESAAARLWEYVPLLALCLAVAAHGVTRMAATVPLDLTAAGWDRGIPGASPPGQFGFAETAGQPGVYAEAPPGPREETSAENA